VIDLPAAALAHAPPPDLAAFDGLTPFGFAADAGRVTAILTDAGFGQVDHAMVERPLETIGALTSSLRTNAAVVDAFDA
jgi:hypothetical protein